MNGVMNVSCGRTCSNTSCTPHPMRSSIATPRSTVMRAGLGAMMMRDAGTMVMFASTPYAHLHMCGSRWDGNEFHLGDRGVWTMTYGRPEA
jgi:hypothetical protein